MIKERTRYIGSAILRFIDTSIKQRGFPPTEREIARYFGFTQGTAHYYLKLLKNKEMLSFRFGRKKRNSRGLKIKNKIRRGF